jgi:ankyrin repeat protein
LLLEKKADVNAVIPGGCLGTSLNVAASGGYVDIVKLMLENGAGVTAIATDIKRVRIPFQAAIINGHTTVVRLLLEVDGVDIEEPWKEWWGNRLRTPLQHAIAKGYKEMEQLLREKGARDISLEEEFHRLT